MSNLKPSLIARLLRAAADWAGARHGTPSTGRTERRRRARQRLKDRAALAEVFRATTLDLGAQVEALRQTVDRLNAEREQAQRQAEALNWLVDDLVQRNSDLLELCAESQHEAAHWKRFVEDDRAHELEMERRLHIN